MRCRFIIKNGRRHRYIGFKINADKGESVLKKGLINEIREQNKTGLYVVRFNGEVGIIRCSNIEKDNTINFLKNINKIDDQKVKIETLGTSGTIKTLIKKHMTDYEI